MAPWKIIIPAAVVVVIAAAFIVPLFLPKSGATFDEELPEGAAASEGSELVGRDGHSASGTVALIQVDGAWFLRFEDIKQTQGPDVYLYLTQEAHAYDKSDVQGGMKVPVPQGDDGQFTARGSFNVPLPDDFEPGAYAGITTWCDRFSVPFSSAAL